jgi:hypothetical protein
MKTALPREHRRILESTVAQARTQAEDGAAKALKALAVGAAAPQAHATPDQKKLRVQLRAHGRALGDAAAADGTQATAHLVTEIAYEHWHRMLFARFLAESNLLMHPDGYPVSLADCKEDANTIRPAARSEWEVAGRYASAMLPNVFRVDSPVLALELPLEAEQALEALLAKLPPQVFQADDSLGWSYQFWQAKKKKEVRRQLKQAGTKVGGDELPAMTQLFTEHYMVAFILENTLGAWMKDRHPRMNFPVDMPYFRKSMDGVPAAGSFQEWPSSLETFKLLDPCLGSGHFLVAALHYIVAIRCATEQLSVRDAVDRVLADNLYGLELDARCVEIAAFALALTAWRFPDERGNALGYRTLPRLNIACVGVAPRTKRAEWLRLAGGDSRLKEGMAALYDLFQLAPELGSLISPPSATFGNLLDAHWEELETKLEQALSSDVDDHEIEGNVTAQGIVHASRILSRHFHLVVTNPPYLGSGQHGTVIGKFCETHYENARFDLANVFMERSLKFCKAGSTCAFVVPQNWLSLKNYQPFRGDILRSAQWNFLVGIGEHGFESTEAGGAFTVLVCLTKGKPSLSHRLSSIDVSQFDSPNAKALALKSHEIAQISQGDFIKNPQQIISLASLNSKTCLKDFAVMAEGLSRGDVARFDRYFWEIDVSAGVWCYLLNSPQDPAPLHGGREVVFLWENGNGSLSRNSSARIQGQPAWGRSGIFVARSRKLKVTLTCGHVHAQSGVAVVPRNPEDLAALWLFCSSPRFNELVRKLTPKILIPTGMLASVPLNLADWRVESQKKYPNGLPEPYSNDPTQWIFHGHPKQSTSPLHVCLIRLLGGKWPAEIDKSLALSEESKSWVAQCAYLDALVDDDGIVCIPAVRGESPAVDRLRALLARAFGKDWSPSVEARLLTEAGCEGYALADWIRDKYFEQHIILFKRRPFIWHIWDGHKDGFSALLNYKFLTREKLNTLIHLYLGDWITQQKRAVELAVDGASVKLAKAVMLKSKLEAIQVGDRPLDVFVRWKAMNQQSVGWNPDVNDGVRLNIRPFVKADVLRVSASKLGVDWSTDNGKDDSDAPWFGLGEVYGENLGSRINQHHISISDKVTNQALKKARKKGAH